ncbi:hypothetical protein Hanom_Chr16g01434271 [Helianthus anomalus]
MSILDPFPISSVSGVFDDDVEGDDVENDDEEDDEEEDDDDILKDDAEDVYSASDDDDDDDGNDDDDQGSTCIKVTEASNEEKIDEYLHDDANEESENAMHGVDEGEIMHTYTLAEIVKMTHVDENNFKFDFEEELNQFDINQQP